MMTFKNPLGKGTMGRGGLKRGRMISFKKRSRGGAGVVGPIPMKAVRKMRGKRMRRMGGAL